MGRATRWLRNLLGSKKDSKESRDSGFSTTGDDRREKKRWSFKSGRDSAEVAEGQVPVSSVDNAAWLRSMYSETEKEQNKHAIAVAAATAAAADAAVAAAQAAVAVVRLTSQGRGTMFGGVQERIAAIKIQTVFRSYLAKKALKALKALVKLQALVRGYLVRKQAARTLHSMQALIRAQATVRAHKSRFLPDINPRKSLEKFDDMNSVHSRRLSGNLDNGFDRSPKIVEIDTCRPKSRSSRSRISPSVIDSTEDSMNLNWNISSISIPDTARNFHDFDYRYSSTAQSTPRYLCIAPSTPAKSVCGGDGGFNCPNYMSNTRSFEAKVRSQSAPKQRPELGPRKRLPLSEVLIESRASLSGVGMQRSCARAQEVAAGFNFKSAVVDRLDRSLEFGRETERDYYLQRKW